MYSRRKYYICSYSKPHMMTESHCRAMMRLIDEEILMLKSRQIPNSSKTKDTNEPYVTEYRSEDLTLQEAKSIKIVSYNILSDAQFNGDYYRKIDGSVNSINEVERKECINGKIKAWLESGYIVCLQEVTRDFTSKTINENLHSMLKEYEYNSYSHSYNYDPKTEKFTLGLAILVPNAYFSIELNELLYPWNNPEWSIVDRNTSRDNKSKITEVNEEKDDVFSLAKPSIDKKKIVQNAKKYIEKWSHGENGKDIMKKIIDDHQSLDIQQLITHFCTAIKQKNGLPEKLQNPIDVAKDLQKKSLIIINENETMTTKYKQYPRPYRDRTVLVLHLKDHSEKSLLIANVHIPCKYKDIKVMTSLALKAKISIINWMQEKILLNVPMILCGDFNSDPQVDHGTAYNCIKGSISFDESYVNKDTIEIDEFDTYVTQEQWTDCLSTAYTDGFTNYGLTKQSLKNRLEMKYTQEGGIDLSIFSEYILDHDEKIFAQCLKAYSEKNQIDIKTIPIEQILIDSDTVRQNIGVYLKPTARHLDHIFLRDNSSTLEISERKCPLKSDISTITGGDPIPNLTHDQPSDHLPISVTFKFK